MPKLSKDDIVRAEILKAAERVFQKWGINKTTMEDIAREAGKGKSTLYYYYQSKEEIFDAVVIIEFEKILQRAKELAQETETAKERLIKYIVESINEMKSRISTYTIIREEIRRNQNFIKKLRDIFQPREEKYIQEILIFGMENKEFTFINKSEVTIAAKTITGMIHALELYLFFENDDTAQIDIAARFIVNGI
ncbi:MAG: helix-turn-helix domain-containing protein [Bacteroidota bacterium]|jgi:AcrR family transcriptional regulator